MTPITVSIVIPVWGDPTITDRCLASLSWSCSGADVLLIDNTRLYSVPLSNVPRGVRSFATPHNLGCTAAKIIGENLTKSDIIVFLDCDTEGQMDWLSLLLQPFKDPTVAMAGPTLNFPTGGIQSAGIETWHGSGDAGGRNIQHPHAGGDVDGVSGACMAVRRRVLEEVGGHDPGYYNGYDDVDLCLTVKEAGHRIVYVPESVVIHYESSTGPERGDRMDETVAHMREKWSYR